MGSKYLWKKLVANVYCIKDRNDSVPIVSTAPITAKATNVPACIASM